MLRHFDTDIVRKRPSGPLGGRKWSEILDRVEYARRSEPDKLPKVVVAEEDKRRMLLEYEWPKDSKWYGSGDVPEYYYKKEREFRSYVSVHLQLAKRQIDKLRKEIRESGKQ